jgi:hypothetical protein
LVLLQLLFLVLCAFLDNESLFLLKVLYPIVEFFGVLQQFLFSFGLDVFPEDY